MKINYDLSHLNENEYNRLAQDMLNRALKLNLKPYTFINRGPDLIQKNVKGQVEVVAEIKGHKLISLMIIEHIIKRIEEDIASLNPKKYILIFFSDLNSKIYTRLNEHLSKIEECQFSYYGIDWIQEQLGKYSDITNKFKLNQFAETEQVSNKKNQ